MLRPENRIEFTELHFAPRLCLMHVKMKMTSGKMMPRMRWIIVIHNHWHDLSPRYAYFICIIKTISACYLYETNLPFE